MKRSIACLLVLVMGSPLSMWSQSQVANPTEAQAKKLVEGDPASKAKREVEKRGAGERSRVRVTLRNQDEVKGYISQIDTDTFQVTGKKSGRVTTIAYQDVARIRGGGMSTVAKIAITAGVVAGAMIGLGLLAYKYRP
jgi:hypothetical protein